MSPYTLGSLRTAVLYPNEDEDVPPERIAAALKQVGLAGLSGELDAVENWAQRLSIGDTVIWDNRGVLHRAAPYDPSSSREMLRTTVLGDEPIQ